MTRAHFGGLKSTVTKQQLTYRVDGPFKWVCLKAENGTRDTGFPVASLTNPKRKKLPSLKNKQTRIQFGTPCDPAGPSSSRSASSACSRSESEPAPGQVGASLDASSLALPRGWFWTLRASTAVRKSGGEHMQKKSKSPWSLHAGDAKGRTGSAEAFRAIQALNPLQCEAEKQFCPRAGHCKFPWGHTLPKSVACNARGNPPPSSSRNQKEAKCTKAPPHPTAWRLRE